MRSTGLARALAAAAVLTAVLFAAPIASPGPVAGVGPLPACRLDDILTEPRTYDDWRHIEVDWILSLGADYKPPDLVSVQKSGIAGGGLIREVAIDDLTAMVTAAKKNGTPLVSWSPYRGYKQQVTLFNGYAGYSKKTGKYSNFKSAITFSARPGHSEHQTGLTIDFVAVGDHGLTSNWEVTRTGAWMAKHAWEYGWLMSYPKGKTDVTCYRYEPWHYRYVGRELAKEIHDSGLTIREYLWANFTQVDPNCVALPAPPLVTPGVPRSCAFPDATTDPTSGAPGSAPPASGPPASGPPATAGPTVDASPGAPASAGPTEPPATQNTSAGIGPAGVIAFGAAVILVLIGIVALARRRGVLR
jgi:zinc D-Ala-D-Ala carboxypeptidase